MTRAAPLEESAVRWLIEHRDRNGAVAVSVGRTEAGYLVRSHGVADYSLSRAGALIGVVAHEGASSDDVDRAFEQQVLPGTHQLRGAPALHASAVVAPHGAIGLCGDSGAGKSTLAALLSRTWPLLADDYVPLRVDGPAVVATGTSREVRLREPSADALGADADALAAKRAFRPRAFAEHAPLVAIVLLSGEADTITIGPITRRDALLALASHVHRLDPTDQALMTEELAFLASVVERVPVVRLRYPRRFDIGEAIANRLSELGLRAAGR